MATITLYIPNGSAENYEAESAPHVDSAGVLRFRVDGQDVVTTVPFIVKYPVKAKAVVTTQQRPTSSHPSRTSAFR